MPSSSLSLASLATFIVCSSVGQICMKIGLRGRPVGIARSPFRTLANVVAAVFRPWVTTGLLLYVIGAVAWLLLLSGMPLSVAYPMISLGYVAVVVLSALVLRERVRWHLALPGLLLIATGVSLIGSSLR
jgi:drug/metabolite transporter (DMT)-like permease